MNKKSDRHFGGYSIEGESERKWLDLEIATKKTE